MGNKWSDGKAHIRTIVGALSEGRSNGLRKSEWWLFAVLALFCYVSFVQGDLFITGNRSWWLWDGPFTQFYERSYEITGGYGANYLPSTFILFAIWILPLKLLGFPVPQTTAESRLLYNMWYKLLPVLFYLASAYLIYRVAKVIGMGDKKAKICMYAFLTLPIAFYSQFIFSQYDIFTVFFMLLGLFYYFRNDPADRWRFCICMGVAITFKYFAALIFFALLLLDEKKVFRVLQSTALALLPLLIEVALFWQSPSFHRSVFGFSAVQYTSQHDFSTIIGSLSFFTVVCCFIVAWPFFVYPKNRQDRAKWALYFCCGVCFAIFGFATWHPQWLLFAAPFWVLSAFINRELEKFLWLDTALIVVFYPFILQAWKGGVDEATLENGVWKYLLRDTFHLKRMGDYLDFVDRTTLYSALFVLLLIMFVFKHPKYALDDFTQDDGSQYIGLLRLRIVAAALLFIIPASLCVAESLKRKNDVFFARQPSDWAFVMGTDTHELHFSNVSGELEGIYIYTGTSERVNDCEVVIQLVEEESGSVLTQTVLEGESAKNLEYTQVRMEPTVLQADTTYKIVIFSTDATAANCIALGVESDVDETGHVYSTLGNVRQEFNYSMVLDMKDLCVK